MRDIHCPKDIGLNNIFIGEDCKAEQWYDNCYHCWSSAIAENNQEYYKGKIKEELEELKTEIQTFAYPYDGLFNEIVDLTRIEEIFDKHISTLKG